MLDRRSWLQRLEGRFHMPLAFSPPAWLFWHRGQDAAHERQQLFQ
jgi:hypothetical protein